MIEPFYFVIFALHGYPNYINIFNIPVVILVLARVSLPLGNYILFLLPHKRFPLRENDIVFKKGFPRVAWEWLKIYILFYLFRFLMSITFYSPLNLYCTTRYRVVFILYQKKVQAKCLHHFFLSIKKSLC